LSESVTLKEVGRNAVAAHVKASIRAFLKNDSNLLALNANERAITHKFAEYLAARFPNWDVDCEYDRLLEEAKKLRLRGEITRVIPDIIVHRRNTKNNLLVIEAKKDNDPRGMGAGREKLREFRRQLHYRHAVFLRFRTGENAGIESPVWI
jgi:hypothetical protein